MFATGLGLSLFLKASICVIRYPAKGDSTANIREEWVSQDGPFLIPGKTLGRSSYNPRSRAIGQDTDFYHMCRADKKGGFETSKRREVEERTLKGFKKSTFNSCGVEK